MFVLESVSRLFSHATLEKEPILLENPINVSYELFKIDILIVQCKHQVCKTVIFTLIQNCLPFSSKSRINFVSNDVFSMQLHIDKT